MGHFHTIKIEVERSGLKCRVLLDGTEVQGVADVFVVIGVMDESRVTLTLVPEQLIIEGHPGIIEIERLQADEEALAL